VRVVNNTRTISLGDRIDVADTSKKRRTGLLKHTGLEPREGLWIAPCEAVHTVGMKFPIDVLFLNKKRKVLKIRHAMGKWSMALCLRAHSALELPAGTARATGTQVHDELEFER
jgi:uncharacterized membrane protein (UPF0127 family)